MAFAMSWGFTVLRLSAWKPPPVALVAGEGGSLTWRPAGAPCREDFALEVPEPDSSRAPEPRFDAVVVPGVPLAPG